MVVEQQPIVVVGVHGKGASNIIGAVGVSAGKAQLEDSTSGGVLLFVGQGSGPQECAGASNGNRLSSGLLRVQACAFASQVCDFAF